MSSRVGLLSRALLAVLLALMWVGLVPASAPAQTNATLRVVVTSEDDNRPLQGANVVLKELPEENIAQGGVTDRDGYLEMGGLSPNTYLLEVSYVGFETRRDTLSIEEGRQLRGVSLSVEPRRLEEVQVEAEGGAARRQAGLQTIRAAEVNRIPTPGPTGDLASYIQTLPGVVSVGDRGGQVYIRGGAPTQNRYLVDGLPVVQPFHISNFYSAFSQEVVQSADLYAGGFGAEYGEAISSVLDVRLRPGDMNQYSGSASLGPHLASATVEGPLVDGEQSLLASARYSLLEEVASPLLGREESIGFYDVTGRYSFRRESTSCNVTALRTHDQGSVGPQQDLEYTWSNTVVGGRCFFRSPQFEQTFSIRGGYTDFHNSVGTVGAPEQQADHWRLYLALDGDQRILGQPVDFGGRVMVGAYDAKIDEQFVGVETLSRSQNLVRVHWSIEWSISNSLTVTPSIAAQVTNPIRLSADPRLRMSFRPGGTDTHEITLAAGIYHQSDEGISDPRDAGSVFTVLRSPGSGDNPIPRSLQVVTGYRYQVGPGLEASVEGYARRLQNIPLPKWTPEVGTNTETALGTGLAYGADVRLELQEGPFYAYLGYGWSKVTYEAAADDLGAWTGGEIVSYTPAHDRRHQLNVVSSYEFMGISASMSWEFGTGRPFTKAYGYSLSLDPPDDLPTEKPGTAHTLYQRPYGARLPAYHRLDVSLERSFNLAGRLALDVRLGAINVYDRPNIFYFDLDTLQRVEQTPLLPYVSVTLHTE